MAVNINPKNTNVQVNSAKNVITITNKTSNKSVLVQPETTKIVQVNSPGPMGPSFGGTLTGSLNISGSSDFSGDVLIEGNLKVEGSSSFEGNISASGGTISGSKYLVSTNIPGSSASFDGYYFNNQWGKRNASIFVTDRFGNTGGTYPSSSNSSSNYINIGQKDNNSSGIVLNAGYFSITSSGIFSSSDYIVAPRYFVQQSTGVGLSNFTAGGGSAGDYLQLRNTTHSNDQIEFISSPAGQMIRNRSRSFSIVLDSQNVTTSSRFNIFRDFQQPSVIFPGLGADLMFSVDNWGNVTASRGGKGSGGSATDLQNSGNISASGFMYASKYFGDDGNNIGTYSRVSNTTTYGNPTNPTVIQGEVTMSEPGGLLVNSNISASGDVITSNISASGYVSASQFIGSFSGSINNAVTASYSISSSYAESSNHFTASFISSSGYVSASQFIGSLTGSITPSSLPSGIISGSSQLPSGIISSSTQLPSGIISSSLQLPSGIISGSDHIFTAITSSGNISASGYISASEFSGLFTGSLFGSSSYATTSSFAMTASYAHSASIEITHEVSSSYAESASFAQHSDIFTASIVSASGTIIGNTMVVNTDTPAENMELTVVGDVSASGYNYTNLGLFVNQTQSLVSVGLVLPNVGLAFGNSNHASSLIGNVVNLGTNDDQHTTTSGNISASGDIFGNVGTFNDLGNITASGNISSSGYVSASQFIGSFTGSFFGTIESSSYATTASFAQHSDHFTASIVSASAQIISPLFSIDTQNYFDKTQIAFTNTGDNLALRAGISGVDQGQPLMDSKGGFSFILDSDGAGNDAFFNLYKGGSIPALGTQIFHIDNSGNITASSNISASGYISASQFIGSFTGSISGVESSSYATSASFAQHSDNFTASIVTASQFVGAESYYAVGQQILSYIPAYSTFYFGNSSFKTQVQGTNILLNAPVTASGNVSSSGIIRSQDLTVDRNITSNTSLNVNGLTTFSGSYGNYNTPALGGGQLTAAVVTGSIIPQVDVPYNGTHELGSKSNPWRKVWVQGASLEFVSASSEGTNVVSESFTYANINRLQEGKTLATQSIGSLGTDYAKYAAWIHPQTNTSYQKLDSNRYQFVILGSEVFDLQAGTTTVSTNNFVAKNISASADIVANSITASVIQNITTTNITASTISASGEIIASKISSLGSEVILENGNITASGNISASGNSHVFGGEIQLFNSTSGSVAHLGRVVSGKVVNTFAGNNVRNVFGGDGTNAGTADVANNFYGSSAYANFFGAFDADGEEVMKGGGSVAGSNLVFQFGDVGGAGNSVIFKTDVANAKFDFEVGYVDIHNTTAATDATGDTGALRVEGGASIAKNISLGTHITASGDISASADVLATTYRIQGQRFANLDSSDVITIAGDSSSPGVKFGKHDGTLRSYNFDGHITASGNISASGDIYLSDELFMGGVRTIYRQASTNFIATTDRKTEIDGTNIILDAPVTASGTISGSATTSNFIAATGSFQKLTGDTTQATALEVEGYVSASYFTGNILYQPGSISSGAIQGEGDIIYFGNTATTAGTIYTINPAGGWTESTYQTAASATGSLAMALGTNSTTHGMLLKGTAKVTSDPSAPIGSPLYLFSNGRANSAFAYSSGEIARIVGYYLKSGGTILFDPDKTWVVVS